MTRRRPAAGKNPARQDFLSVENISFRVLHDILNLTI